jgi:hypothetical protein
LDIWTPIYPPDSFVPSSLLGLQAKIPAIFWMLSKDVNDEVSCRWVSWVRRQSCSEMMLPLAYNVESLAEQLLLGILPPQSSKQSLIPYPSIRKDLECKVGNQDAGVSEGHTTPSQGQTLVRGTPTYA